MVYILVIFGGIRHLSFSRVCIKERTGVRSQRVSFTECAQQRVHLGVSWGEIVHLY